MHWKQMGHVQIFGGPGLLSTSQASVMKRSMTAGASYPPNEKMCIVQHQPYISRGTEAIPTVRCSRPQGSEQKEKCGRFGPTPPPAGFGVRVHPPRRGAPDRCCCVLLSCVLLSCVLLSCVLLSCVLLSCVLLSCVLLSCVLLSCVLLSWVLLSCVLLSCVLWRVMHHYIFSTKLHSSTPDYCILNSNLVLNFSFTLYNMCPCVIICYSQNDESFQ